MRTGITVAGILVLIFGLAVAGVGAYYADITSQWVGAAVAVVGLIAGIAGAAMSGPAPKAPT